MHILYFNMSSDLLLIQISYLKVIIFQNIFYNSKWVYKISCLNDNHHKLYFEYPVLSYIVCICLTLTIITVHNFKFKHKWKHIFKENAWVKEIYLEVTCTINDFMIYIILYFYLKECIYQKKNCLDDLGL